MLVTFVNRLCDIKINIKIVQNCCRNLAVRGLKSGSFCRDPNYFHHIVKEVASYRWRKRSSVRKKDAVHPFRCFGYIPCRMYVSESAVVILMRSGIGSSDQYTQLE